jgi:hypothetical protein
MSNTHLVYLLTNGYADKLMRESNYICAFKDINSALSYAKIMNIHPKYDLYTVECKLNKPLLNLVIQHTVSYEVTIRPIDNYESFIHKMEEYYKGEYDLQQRCQLCLEDGTFVSQYFGNRETGLHTFVYIGNLAFS